MLTRAGFELAPSGYRPVVQVNCEVSFHNTQKIILEFLISSSRESMRRQKKKSLRATKLAQRKKAFRCCICQVYLSDYLTICLNHIRPELFETSQAQDDRNCPRPVNQKLFNILLCPLEGIKKV